MNNNNLNEKKNNLKWINELFECLGANLPWNTPEDQQQRRVDPYTDVTFV